MPAIESTRRPRGRCELNNAARRSIARTILPALSGAGVTASRTSGAGGCVLRRGAAWLHGALRHPGAARSVRAARPTENVAALVKRALLRLDPCLAAQAAPLLLLRTDERREFLRRIRGGIGAAGA